jgi:hypothetical protein
VKFRNVKTGARLILGVGRNQEAERLEADPDWVRVSGSDITAVREMQAREAEFLRRKLEREQAESQPPIVPVLLQLAPAAEDPEETEPADKDGGDAGLYDDGAVPDEVDAE